MAVQRRRPYGDGFTVNHNRKAQKKNPTVRYGTHYGRQRPYYSVRPLVGIGMGWALVIVVEVVMGS
jgi:hypothetical protein